MSTVVPCKDTFIRVCLLFCIRLYCIGDIPHLRLSIDPLETYTTVPVHAIPLRL